MKKLLLIMTGGIFLLSSCNKESIRGNGAVNTENRTVGAFTDIELGGDADLTIGYGTTQQVTVTGYQNLLPVYETKVQGNTLYLQFRSDIYNVRNNNIKVNIQLPVLAYVRINGSGKINATGFASGDLLTASINGSGDIFIADSKYNKVTYTVNGSGNIKAASNITTEAEARISGSGNINYWGNPVTVETQVSGSGRINKK